jgi:hypothetical protein
MVSTRLFPIGSVPEAFYSEYHVYPPRNGKYGLRAPKMGFEGKSLYECEMPDF